VPLPFEVEYACTVDNPLEVEKALHVAFGPHRLNPRREFFRMDPGQAIAILHLLNKPDATADVAKPSPEVDEASIQAVEQAKSRRPALNFTEMGIPMGAILVSTPHPDVTVTVIAPKKVKLGDEETSLSAATQQTLGLNYAVRPVAMWTYNGRSLGEIYRETYGESS
jgi:hypothetical protein